MLKFIEREVERRLAEERERKEMFDYLNKRIEDMEHHLWKLEMKLNKEEATRNPE